MGEFPVLALNGDSFVQVDVQGMLRFHRLRGARLTVEGLFVDIGVPEDYQRLANAPEAFLAAAG